MKNNEYNDFINKMKCTEEFRADMRKKLEAPPAAADDYGDRVGGTEIAPKRNASRVIAWAASLVLVCGAIGGGVFLLNKKGDPDDVKGTATSSSVGEAATGETAATDAATERLTEEAATDAAPSDGYGEDVSKETILSAFESVGEKSFAQWLEGPTIVPQGNRPFETIQRRYDINDLEALKNELAALEWVTCSKEEALSATETIEEIDGGSFYFSKGGYDIVHGYTGIYREGYLYHFNDYMEGDYFKLKDMNDADKLREILDERFVMDKASEVADKVWKSIGKFKSLEADYVYESAYGDNIQNARGTMKYDGVTGKMRMDGEGLINGCDVTIDIIMKNGLPEDHNFWGPQSTFLTKDKTTGEIKEILADYGYSTVMCYKPDFHYALLAKDIERALANSYQEFTNCVFEEKAVGENTEYHIKRTELWDEGDGGKYEGSTCEYTLVLDPEGRVISYEQKTDNAFGGDWRFSFKLENYKFDSDDFVMEDVDADYEAIKDEYIRRSVSEGNDADQYPE